MNEIKEVKSIVIKNVNILPGSFRNFRGEKSAWNMNGERSFCVEIDPNIAEELINVGWKVKPRKSLNDDGNQTYFLKVKVQFNPRRMPEIAIVDPVKKTKVMLTEETVGNLDSAIIKTADILINPRIWRDEKTGEENIKAYLGSLFVVLDRDELSEEYSDYVEL